MRAAGRPGRGERARVAARVRDLLAGNVAAVVGAGEVPARDFPNGDPVTGGDPAARTLPVHQAPESAPSWLPGADFELHVPQPGAAARTGWRDRLRWDPGHKGAAALGVAAVAAVAATGWWLAASRPHEVPISSSAGQSSVAPLSAGSSSGSGLPASGAASSGAALSGAALSGAALSGAASVVPAGTSAASLVVDVAGKVRHPGIYTLPAGARVDDALRAAGGANRGVSTLSLNLAAPVHDGQQIVVGIAGAPGLDGGSADVGASAAGSSGTASIVDLNTATLEQLETLPGVGPVLGQHILDWRSAHGQFASVDQLREVSGIGDGRFAQLRPLVTT